MGLESRADGDGSGSQEKAGHSREEWLKTGLAFLLCFLAMFLNSLVAAATHDLSPWGRVLTDQVFETVPAQVWAMKAGDTAAAITAIALLGLIPFHAHAFIVFRRITNLAGFLYALRAICLAFTTLPVGYPDPENWCVDQRTDFDFGAILTRAVISFFTMGSNSGVKVPCGDLFFSGHTIVLTLSVSFNQLYLPRKLRLYVALLWALFFFGVVSLTISRNHYSIDIIASFVITRSTFALFHAFLLLPQGERERLRFGRLSLLLVYIQWMEGRTPFGPLPTRLSWPLPWPKPFIYFFENISDDDDECESEA